MLSQYSWWDLIKVVLVGLFVYYAYVLWVYYREDIREWISNRRQKPDLQPQLASYDEEEDSSSLYAVQHYAPESLESPAWSQAAYHPEPQSPAVEDTVELQPWVPEPTLDGLALDMEDETAFSIPIAIDAQNPAEQSLSDLMNAAQRLQANEEGVLIPDDPADAVAVNLAEVINQQQGKVALAGISFNR